ncbi:MAG TPA: HAD-IIIA family hydrolase [Bacteroidales bacterium]|nr:HAD-IIIA family hydrolase [Bacteroidales bacterium]
MKQTDFKPDNEWTLFLDRDGVLNRRLPGGYVKNPEDFVWIDGVLNSLSYFSGVFGRLIVVTNQQGIGKGLMSSNDLENIHQKMLNDVKSAGGRIDKVYFCSDLENSGSFYRKPMIGMGLKAKRDFKEIDFRKAVMVGDTLSDMRFGRRLKMKTVFISDDISIVRSHPYYIDFRFGCLAEFAEFIRQKN